MSLRAVDSAAFGRPRGWARRGPGPDERLDCDRHALAGGQQSNEDALALMRAYAFSHDKTLDDLANQLVLQGRPTDVLLP
jgi:hypothetical protein